MYGKLSVAGFVVVCLGILAHSFLKPVAGGLRGPAGLMKLKLRAFAMLIPKKGMSVIGILKRLALAVGLICFVLLLITGFLPLVFGHHLNGYMLMLHATCAPVFVVCVAFLGLTWAKANAFVGDNGKALLKLLGISMSPSSRADKDFGLLSKCCFWCLLTLSLPLTLSIILSMFPLFGKGQRCVPV